MGTKNLYENGPNPLFLFGTKSLVRPTLMGTKNLYENGLNRQVWGVLIFFKVAVNTIVPRSPSFFFFCNSKPRLLHTSEKTRSNISVNEMALFVLFPTCGKGKTFVDTHGE